MVVVVVLVYVTGAIRSCLMTVLCQRIAVGLLTVGDYTQCQLSSSTGMHTSRVTYEEGGRVDVMGPEEEEKKKRREVRCLEIFYVIVA